jgi:hypothetical protein
MVGPQQISFGEVALLFICQEYSIFHSYRFNECSLFLELGVKTERIRMNSSETVFITIFFLNSELERIVCGYEYEIGVYR